ncbi:MAG: TIGR03790 family protein [Methylococcaceae bacterium]|nr:TIGR03790 family protein [Methylococcaceae bacterium]
MFKRYNRKVGLWSIYCVLLLLGSNRQALAISPLYRPLPALTAKDLAVIVNDDDPLSVQIARYYQQKRKIPPAQIIHIRFKKVGTDAMSQSQFATLKQQVDRQTPKQVQAYALTWIQPFKVDCMSMTTAFALGFNQAFCAAGCLQTHNSPYFASNSSQPFQEDHIRPTMVVAGQNFAQAKQLIDRGVAADYTHPQGSGYLLKTSDVARSSRAELFPKIAENFKGVWPIHYLEQDTLENKTDVMFYFTGLVSVPNISSNTYLPGAVADHLTSTGGVLSGSGQMNSLDWLKAGATGTYGAVVEPCNFPAKFPNPEVLIHFYLRGSSLIEAYWKSVQQPGQGIFVGEPLAKPFAYPLATEIIK